MADVPLGRRDATDGRWEAATLGLRVLCWIDHDDRQVYGEITGYDPAKQSFYVVLEEDVSGEPYFLHWASVRPA